MAYGAKYILEFSDIYSSTPGDYAATIYKKDYTGTTTDINGNTTPLTIETDRVGNASYKPVVASKCTLNVLMGENELPILWEDALNNWESYSSFWNSGGLDLFEFLTADTDTFRLEIEKGGNVIWSGYYILTSDVALDEIVPLEISLQFSDMILLKSTEYYESTNLALQVGFGAGEKTNLFDLVVSGLALSGTATELRLNIPTVISSEYIITVFPTLVVETINHDLHNTYILKNGLMKSYGDYLSYFEILTSICSQFGLICYQKNNIIYICGYDNLVNLNTRTFKRYSLSTGSYIADVTETDTYTGVNTASFGNIGQSQSARYSLPYKFLDITNSISVANNNNNCHFKAGEYRRVAGVDERAMASWDNIGFSLNSVAITGSLGWYSSTAVAPLDRHFASGITAPIAVQDNAKYFQSEDIDVKFGDTINIGFKTAIDARFTGAYPPQTKVAIILKTKDPNDPAAELTFYLNDNFGGTGGLSFVNTLTYLTSSTDVDIKNLKINTDGKLSMRFLLPFSAGYPGGSTVEDNLTLWIRYAMIQTYRGSANSNGITPLTHRTYYDDIKNNKDSLVLNTDLYLFDGYQYTTSLITSSYSPPLFNGLSLTASISNRLMTESYDAIGMTLDTPGTTGSALAAFSLISKPIHKNTGLINATIDGDYRVTQQFSVGDKFTYKMTGLTQKIFVLLDYKIDFKQSTMTTTLYSSEFTDSAGLTAITKIVTN
jgi:hypothetical protein